MKLILKKLISLFIDLSLLLGVIIFFIPISVIIEYILYEEIIIILLYDKLITVYYVFLCIYFYFFIIPIYSNLNGITIGQKILKLQYYQNNQSIKNRKEIIQNRIKFFLTILFVCLIIPNIVWEIVEIYTKYQYLANVSYIKIIEDFIFKIHVLTIFFLSLLLFPIVTLCLSRGVYAFPQTKIYVADSCNYELQNKKKILLYSLLLLIGIMTIMYVLSKNIKDKIKTLYPIVIPYFVEFQNVINQKNPNPFNIINININNIGIKYKEYSFSCKKDNSLFFTTNTISANMQQIKINQRESINCTLSLKGFLNTSDVLHLAEKVFANSEIDSLQIELIEGNLGACINFRHIITYHLHRNKNSLSDKSIYVYKVNGQVNYNIGFNGLLTSFCKEDE